MQTERLGDLRLALRLEVFGARGRHEPGLSQTLILEVGSLAHELVPKHTSYHEPGSANAMSANGLQPALGRLADSGRADVGWAVPQADTAHGGSGLGVRDSEVPKGVRRPESCFGVPDHRAPRP